MIPADQLVPGDMIEVFDGDVIPADICILSASSLKVDNSVLTGESILINKSPGYDNESPLETKNMAFMSTYVVELRCWHGH